MLITQNAIYGLTHFLRSVFNYTSSQTNLTLFYYIYPEVELKLLQLDFKNKIKIIVPLNLSLKLFTCFLFFVIPNHIYCATFKNECSADMLYMKSLFPKGNNSIKVKQEKNTFFFLNYGTIWHLFQFRVVLNVRSYASD